MHTKLPISGKEISNPKFSPSSKLDSKGDVYMCFESETPCSFLQRLLDRAHLRSSKVLWVTDQTLLNFSLGTQTAWDQKYSWFVKDRKMAGIWGRYLQFFPASFDFVVVCDTFLALTYRVWCKGVQHQSQKKIKNLEKTKKRFIKQVQEGKTNEEPSLFHAATSTYVLVQSTCVVMIYCSFQNFTTDYTNLHWFNRCFLGIDKLTSIYRVNTGLSLWKREASGIHMESSLLHVQWSCRRRASVGRRSCRFLRWLACSPTGVLSTPHTAHGRSGLKSARSHQSSTWQQKVQLPWTFLQPFPSFHCWL